MSPTPETTIRVLLKRAAKAPADELLHIVDAIEALHKLQAPVTPSPDIGALVKRIEALEERTSFPLTESIPARFR